MALMNENETQNNELAKTTQEIVEQFSVDYPIEFIDSPESPRLSEVAALDAELFGSHQSLSEEEFREIVEKGGVILSHVGPGNQLISEASLMLTSAEDGPSSLERDLPEWLAYCDGAAVSKEYRGKGLQKQLLNAREAVAKEAGKEASAASVRQKNVTSIKSMMRGDYIMLADSPHYYGDEPKDARVVMLKDFELGNPLKELDSDHEMLENSLRGVIEPSAIQEKLDSGADVISIVVQQSDEVDEVYNQAVATLLRNGYIGVACSDIDIGDSDSERSDAMTFIRLESLPLEVAEAVKLRQKEVQSIVG